MILLVTGEIFSDFPDVSFNKVVKPTASGGESSLSGFDGKVGQWWKATLSP